MYDMPAPARVAARIRPEAGMTATLPAPGYAPPAPPQYAPPMQQYAPPVQQYATPVPQYAPPMQQYTPPVQQYAPPEPQYAPPVQQYAPSVRQYTPPVPQYAPPMPQYAPPAPLWVSPEETERRACRHAGNVAGSALLVTYGVQAAVAAVGAILVSLYILFTQGKIGAIPNGALIWITLAAYPLSFGASILLCKGLMKRPWRETFAVRRTRPLYLFACAPVCLGLSAVGVLLDMLLSGFLAQFGITPGDAMIQPGSFGAFDLVLYYILLAVMPPIFEELLFRGALLTLLRRFGDGFAILATAAMFALMHGNLSQAPSAFLFGIAAGLFAVKSGSIWPGVLAHFVNNGLAVTANLVLTFAPAEYQALGSVALNVAYALAGVAGMAVLLLRDRSFLRILPADVPLTVRQRFGRLASSPAVIAFAVLMLVSTALSFEVLGA